MSEYGLRLLGPCTFCGAGTHNGNVHDANCLSSVVELQKKGGEPSYAKLAAAWHAGFEDIEHQGAQTEPELRAYFRGQFCRSNNIERNAKRAA